MANRIGIEVTEDGEKKIQLSGSEEIRKIREHYGKEYVLLAGSVDPAQLARILMEDTEADPIEVLAGLIREAEYDAVLPGGASFGTAEAVTCTALAEKEIPVLAANVYYDGTDGEHEAGENVFTPYAVKTVTVDGHEHKAGILALVFRGADAAEVYLSQRRLRY